MMKELQKAIDTYTDELEEVVALFEEEEITYGQAERKIAELEKKYDAIFETFPEEEIEFDYAYEFASDTKMKLRRCSEKQEENMERKCYTMEDMLHEVGMSWKDFM